MIVNVTKSVFVSSILECAHLCKVESTCKAFGHRNVDDDVNCQVTEGEPKYSTKSENDTNEKWILYTLEVARNYSVFF